MKQRLKQSRKKMRLSQQELAHRLGVSHSTINRWEAGYREPKREHLQLLADIFGVSREWLIFGEDRPRGSQSNYGQSNYGQSQYEASYQSRQMGHQASIYVQNSGFDSESFSRSQGAMPRLREKNSGKKAFSTYSETTMFKHPSEDNPVIAYQGVPGAYSHLACREAFPHLEPLSCASFEDAFEAVENGKAGLAMIPIENSLGGRVADIHHLLPDSNLYIIGEHFQPVHHCLLAPKGAELSKIKEARSHTQALAQCRDTLRELKIKPMKHADTAGAAEEVARLGDPSIAAVASSLAAETYGLDILRNRIEDKIGNVTRFVVMSRTRIEPDPRSGPCLTSFVFQLRSIPAALYKSMGGFATNGVNFTKLESYISIADLGTARFYAEIEGHPADKAVDRAFEELQFFTNKVKILGTFRRANSEF